MKLLVGKSLAKLIVRRAHAQKHTPQQVAHSGQSKLNSNKFTPCVYFNICTQNQSHETKEVFYKHVCAACWA